MFGWINAPACSAKAKKIKKLCGGITAGHGGLPKLGACAGGGILLRTKCLNSASLAWFSESQNL